MKQFGEPEAPQVQEEMLPATFVPPHMIGSMAETYGFDWEGASPAGILKREKLRARNQILRSTGFLAQQDFARAQLSTMVGNLPRAPDADDTKAAAMAGSPVSYPRKFAAPPGGLKAAMQAQQ